MFSKETLASFETNPIFKGLPSEEIDNFLNSGEEIHIKNGESLIKEGDSAEKVFFLINGTLAVSRKDPTTQEDLALSTLKKGDIIGEIAFLDKGPRSASVTATSDATLIAVPFEHLNSQFPKVSLQIAQNISTKLRETTGVALDHLQKKIEEYKKRIFLNKFFIIIIFILGGFAFLAALIENTIQAQIQSPPNRIFITVPASVLCGLIAILITRFSGLPITEFGITTKNWKRALFEGIIFTIPVLALITLLKWLAIEYHLLPEKVHPPLFGGVALLKQNLINIPLYLILTVPSQELLARGVLQGTLKRIWEGKYKNMIAILTTSFTFGATHLFISLLVASIVALASLFLGWIYSRTDNLLSVWASHSLLGVFGFSVLGI